jgi:hypothetical protein
VSVDLDATVYADVRLDVMLSSARDVLRDLVGAETVPKVSVVADRRYLAGRRIGVGRFIPDHDLAALSIRAATSEADPEWHSTLRLEFEVPTGDGVWLLVMDGPYDPRADDAASVSLDGPHVTSACFSPYRTCVGVVLATALALATAEHGQGDFFDEEIRMLRPPATSPAQFVESTRLRPSSGHLPELCERYMRQFGHLGGWPQDATTG